LIALDGTEYHCSKEIHCPNCSTRQRGKGGTEYFHTMLGATLVAPGHDKVIPLEPEFIAPQDGAEKQDCENAAAKRWLAAHGQQYARLNPIYLGDDLFSRQPLCEAVTAVSGHFIFVCKPSSHPLIQEYVTGAGVELATCEETVRHGKRKSTHRYRWIHDVPLRDGKDALKVKWFEIEILNANNEVTYRNSFITDLEIGPANVAALAACGRARWKIENETFNVLNKRGPYYPLRSTPYKSKLLWRGSRDDGHRDRRHFASSRTSWRSKSCKRMIHGAPLQSCWPGNVPSRSMRKIVD
jgi:hypothetical protein